MPGASRGGYSRRATWARVIGIALPLMLAESMDSVLWMTDTYFVSRLGDTAVEAVGLGGYLSWLVFSISSVFYMGTLIVISQAFGARQYGKAERALHESTAASSVLGVAVFALFWAISPHLIEIVAGPRVSEEAKRLALDYFRARLPGTVLSYPAGAISSAYRGAGKTKPVLWASASYTLANALLDPILIFGLLGAPPLGVVGAGAASSLASVVFLAVNAALLKPSIGLRPGLAPPTSLTGTILRLGVPTFAERLTVVAGHLFYLGVIARCGDYSLAAHTIGVRVESLAFLPLFSIGEATAAVVGQSIGAGDPEKARREAWDASLLNMLVGILVGILIVTLSPILPGVFTETAEIRRLAMIYLILAAISEPLFGMAMSLSMSIRGAGNTVAPLIVNIMSYYVFRVLLAPILASIFPSQNCAAGAWLTMIPDFSARVLLLSALLTKYFHSLARRVI